jgi:hypothetical protein
MDTALRLALFCFFVAAGLPGALARAEVQLQPGLWQEVETGTENGMPTKSETTRCMTAEEAKQPSKTIVLDEELRKHCKTLAFERAGDQLTIRLQCGAEAFALSVDAAFTVDTPQRYHGTIKASLNIGLITLSLDKTIDAKRIGDCPDK